MHILFSLDGTILDVSGRSYAVYRDFHTMHGLRPVPKPVYLRAVRTGTPQTAIASRTLPSTLIDTYAVWRESVFWSGKYSGTDAVRPWTTRVLKRLGGTHTVSCISFRPATPELDQLLYSLGVRPLFHHLMTKQPEDRDKTALLLRYISGYAALPTKTMLVGGDETDVRAAMEAGILSVSVPGPRTESFLQRCAPTIVIPSLGAVPRIVARAIEPVA